MPFIPHTEKDLEEMLKVCNVENLDALFKDIPDGLNSKLAPFPGMTESEVLSNISATLQKNKKLPSFLGAGCYNHYVPAIVQQLIMRSELYTSYTQYQPEMSQGYLQALFEFQSMICELTGMEVSITSVYDSGAALGEAALAASRSGRWKRKKVLITKCTHPEKVSILNNFVRHLGLTVETYGYDEETGQMDLEDLKSKVDEATCLVYAESPNFFGVIEEGLAAAGEIAHSKKATFCIGQDLTTLGILKPPSEYDADLIISEGQPFGNAMNIGGSLVGIMASKKEYMRSLPGRIVGYTHDRDGNRAYTLTLQTREQHIRRAKATSNICTNMALNTLAMAVHLAHMGPQGLKDLGETLINATSGLSDKVNDLDGFDAPLFNSYHFREFVVRSDEDPQDINKRLLDSGIQGGMVLKDWFPELGNASLYCVTEMNTDEEIATLIKGLEG